MTLVEIGLAKLQLNRSQLAFKDGDEEVTTATSWFKKTRVDTLRLALHKIKHSLHHPRRGEDFAVVGNTFFRTNETHDATIANSGLIAKRFQAVR